MNAGVLTSSPSGTLNAHTMLKGRVYSVRYMHRGNTLSLSLAPSLVFSGVFPVCSGGGDRVARAQSCDSRKHASEIGCRGGY